MQGKEGGGNKTKSNEETQSKIEKKEIILVWVGERWGPDFAGLVAIA